MSASESRQFTPAGGEVILRMERRDDRVRVSVRDTGIGIPPERVSEVFELERFQAVGKAPHPSTTRRAP